MTDALDRELELQASPAIEYVFEGAGAQPCRVAVPASVYPPREDTKMLDGALAALRLEAGGRLLEIGCGSGAAAIAAALRGMCVTACDVNPLAVAASRGNAERAGVSDRMEVVEAEVEKEGSWPEILGSDYDVICWNIPYLDGSENPTGEGEGGTLGPLEDAALLDLDSDTGWAGALLDSLLHNPDILTAGGVVLLVHSDSVAKRGALAQTRWRAAGFATRTLSSMRLGGDERLSAYAAWLPWGGSGAEWCDSVDSTNSRLLEQAGVEGERLFTTEQTEGRGQRERVWSMHPGDFAGSWTLDSAGGREGNLQLKAALAVAEATACALEFPLPSAHWPNSSCLTHSGVSVRWPNDLWLHSGKAAGCLVETRQQGESSTLVLGIGVNIPAAGTQQHEFPFAGLCELAGFSTDAAGFSCLLDICVASLLESHPVLPDIDPRRTERALWSLMSTLSDGRLCREKNGGWLRPVGLSRDGALRVVDERGSGQVTECREVAELEWSRGPT